MSADPDFKDRQINPNAIVQRVSDGEFYVRELLVRPWSGPDWNHTLQAECEYCHLQIQIILRAPCNVPEFIKVEARRLALIEHLRTEHAPKQKSSDSTPN
jgi:hypothetical protein